MDWKCHWITTFTNYMWTFYFIVIIIASILIPHPITAFTSNNACDWTGSGLSTSRHNRQVSSVYMRCTSGQIIWKYPRGAVRFLLMNPIHLKENFHACLKIYKYDLVDENKNSNSNNNNSDEQQNKEQRFARIYLEAPRRLIPLFGDNTISTIGGGLNNAAGIGGGSSSGSDNFYYYNSDDNDVQVKCFRSINGQVALYVEAEENPFENMPTIFKYNLEFINMKHYSIRPTDIVDQADDINYDIGLMTNDLTKNNNKESNLGGPFWQNMWNIGKYAFHKIIGINDISDEKKQLIISQENNIKSILNETKLIKPIRKAIDEKITGSLGETYEICRPCSEMEMARAYCSGDIVVRGKIAGVQQQPHLGTVEISVRQKKILRNNMEAILDAEDSWRHFYKPSKRKKQQQQQHQQPSAEQYKMNIDDNRLLNENEKLLFFHLPLHCFENQENGEFVFMGRSRFEEMMIVCNPRLDQWARTVNRLANTDDAPCILKS